MLIEPKGHANEHETDPDAHLTPLDRLRKTVALAMSWGLLGFIFLKIVFL